MRERVSECESECVSECESECVNNNSLLFMLFTGSCYLPVKIISTPPNEKIQGLVRQQEHHGYALLCRLPPAKMLFQWVCLGVGERVGAVSE